MNPRQKINLSDIHIEECEKILTDSNITLLYNLHQINPVFLRKKILDIKEVVLENGQVITVKIAETVIDQRTLNFIEITLPSKKGFIVDFIQLFFLIMTHTKQQEKLEIIDNILKSSCCNSYKNISLYEHINRNYNLTNILNQESAIISLIKYINDNNHVILLYPRNSYSQEQYLKNLRYLFSLLN